MTAAGVILIAAAAITSATAPAAAAARESPTTMQSSTTRSPAVQAPAHGTFTQAPATQPSTSDAARAAIDLQQVEALLEDGDRDAAVRRFTQVSALDADRGAAVRAKVNEACDAMLGEVDQMIARMEYPRAAKRLRELLGTFAGLPTASLARQRLAELVSIPQVRREWVLDEHRAAGEAALAAARALRDGGQEEAAYAQFQTVAAGYRDTPAGESAREAVKAFDADDGFNRRRNDRLAAPEARPALSLAENYRAAGRVEVAKKKYEEVIKTFPDTSFAETARRELEAMK